MTFSGVASNFAGVPLAFAFMATLGRLGLVTVLLELSASISTPHGFNILTFWGLTVTYLYFQIPLMVLVVTPAIDGLKREWAEAAETLGASSWQYWRMIALPILMPSALGAAALLSPTRFGAIATAYALTGSSFNIAPILALCPDPRRRAARPQSRLRHRGRDAAITGLSNVAYLALRSRSTVAAMRTSDWR